MQQKNLVVGCVAAGVAVLMTAVALLDGPSKTTRGTPAAKSDTTGATHAAQAQPAGVLPTQPHVEPLAAAGPANRPSPTSTSAATPAARTLKVPALIPEQKARSAEELPIAQRRLEEQWRSQASDLHWTHVTRDYLSAALADADLPASRLKELDCREALCRLQLQLTSDEEAQRLHELRQPDYEMTFFRDGQDYTIFVAREGEPAPGTALTEAHAAADIAEPESNEMPPGQRPESASMPTLVDAQRRQERADSARHNPL